MSVEEQSAFDMQSAALESLESPEEEAQNERDKNAAMKAQGEFDAQRAAAKNSAPAQMNVMI